MLGLSTNSFPQRIWSSGSQELLELRIKLITQLCDDNNEGHQFDIVRSAETEHTT